MYPLIDLTGRRIFIAGASKGIGRATAELMSKLGGKIILSARNEDKLRETLSLLEGEGHALKAFDFTDIGGIDALTKSVAGEIGPLDGLVWCVGITHDRPLNMIRPEDLEKVMRLNFNAFVELVRCFTKRGRFNPGLRIVAVSSIAAIFGKKAHLSYSASKAALNAAIRNMQTELATKDIRLSAVMPGMVNTDMFQEYLRNNDGGMDSPDYKRLIQRQYLGIIEPEYVASTIAFLSSLAWGGGWVCIPTDGGHSSN
ncbi:MAG: SDR family oxidoreductase [Synergistaceae bacterium]|nr:SDR family oxidoreductase [Synergistaceae bacterium]